MQNKFIYMQERGLYFSISFPFHKSIVCTSSIIFAIRHENRSLTIFALISFDKYGVFPLRINESLYVKKTKCY